MTLLETPIRRINALEGHYDAFAFSLAFTPRSAENDAEWLKTPNSEVLGATTAPFGNGRHEQNTLVASLCSRLTKAILLGTPEGKVRVRTGFSWLCHPSGQIIVPLHDHSCCRSEGRTGQEPHRMTLKGMQAGRKHAADPNKKETLQKAAPRGRSGLPPLNSAPLQATSHLLPLTRTTSPFLGTPTVEVSARPVFSTLSPPTRQQDRKKSDSSKSLGIIWRQSVRQLEGNRTMRPLPPPPVLDEISFAHQRQANAA